MAAPSPLGGDLTGLPLRVAGALSGVVYMPSLDATVQELRSEVARLAGGGRGRPGAGALTATGPASQAGSGPAAADVSDGAPVQES